MDEVVLYPVGLTAAVLAVFCVAGWAGNQADYVAALWCDVRAQVVVWARTVVTYALLWAAVVEPGPRGGAR